MTARSFSIILCLLSRKSKLSRCAYSQAPAVTLQARQECLER